MAQGSGENTGVRKGAWTHEEDLLLRECVEKYGEREWHKVPLRAGLNRCRKSCRLRWLNYLHPNIKRGQFEADEVDLIIRLHKLLGNRWSLISGRLPGRTANDIKNFWNSKLCKKQPSTITKAIRPKPTGFSANSKWLQGLRLDPKVQEQQEMCSKETARSPVEEQTMWWDSLPEEKAGEKNGASSSRGCSVEHITTSTNALTAEGMSTDGGASWALEDSPGQLDNLLSDMELWSLLMDIDIPTVKNN